MTPATAPSGAYTFLPLERVIYGAGCLSNLKAEVDRLERGRALVITGRTLAAQTPLVQRVEAALGARHVGTYAGVRQHVPESGIAEAARLAQERQADLLVSVGGGSPIDAAKSVARTLAGDAGGYPPHIAIPTTLSAAEYSHVAGFTDEATKSKTGFSDVRATPRVVILDPEMTLATPPWLWLASGIRALDHAVETLYDAGYHPVNDVLALQAIESLFENLPRCKARPDDVEVRLQCQLAAWMSYFGPGSVSPHVGMSHVIGKRIGATFDVPHGVTSCILMPHVMRYKALDDADAARLAPMARRLGLATPDVPDREAALAAAQAVSDLVRRLELPARLRDVNVPEGALEQIARAAAGVSSSAVGALDVLRQAW